MKAKRRIAWLLSFLMVFSLIMGTSKMQVFAAGTDIEETDYEDDGNGVHEYHAVNGTAYGTITVPEGYVFLVEGGVEVTADEIYLASGAQLTISGTGTLTCSTITASDGATMCLGSNANIPSGVTAVYDGENDITGDTEWEWFTFIYAAGEGKWYADIEPEDPEEPEEPLFEEHYDFCINGLEDGDAYTVEYSYDGTNYSAEGVGIDENENRNCWVDIQEILEEWNNKLYFRVVLNLGDGDSKELLEYGFGWSDENQSYTINEGDNRTGEDYLNVAKDTYQLTFCYPNVTDTSYPHDIHLTVGVPEEDPEEPEETETTVTFRVENYDNADGSHNATGTVYYKFNTDENFTSVTAANMIDGTFSPAIPEGATTVTVKAVADTGSEVNKYNIDFPVSNSGNFINEENVDEIHAALTGEGYVFALSAGSPEFCIRFTQEGAKHYILWNTLSWGGGNVTLENGTVECKKIIFDGKTYTTDSSEVGGNIYSISEITNEWNTAVLYRKLENDDIGYDIFVLPYSPEVVVEFELMPAKGYQIASIPSGAMDDQISEENDIIEEFEPQASSATYQYTFDGSRNIHYVPTFSEGTNTANVTGSSVTSADVATGNNNIAGNLELSVAEMTESNASSTIKTEVGGADAVYLDIDLNQIISKGANRGNWETSLTELDSDVTISLDYAEYNSNDTYYIIREHNGECTRLEASYNSATGKLEFTTDKFSTYAIVCEGSNGNFDVVNRPENDLPAGLDDTESELIERILTNDDKTEMESVDVEVYLKVDDISASVSEADKNLIDGVKGDATVGIYLDIDLFKKVGSTETQITETNGAITISLELPSSLINTNPAITRTYKVVRIHDGVATVIPATFANGKITFATDEFSTYAIIYTDTQNTGGNTGSGNTGSGNTGGGNTGGGNTDGGNAGGGSSTDGSNNNVKDEVPKTGDAGIAYVWFMLALVSGIGALYFGKKGLVFKKGN